MDNHNPRFQHAGNRSISALHIYVSSIRDVSESECNAQLISSVQVLVFLSKCVQYYSDVESHDETHVKNSCVFVCFRNILYITSVICYHKFIQFYFLF